MSAPPCLPGRRAAGLALASLLALLALFPLLPATAVAAPVEGVPAEAAAAAPAAPGDAQAWLARMRAAASSRNYQGTMMYVTATGVMSSSRVAHFCVGDQVYERIETLDGRPRQVYRHNERVHTVWPGSGVTVVEQGRPTSPLPSVTQSVDPSALLQYELRDEGQARVAGREARVLRLQPRDALRYAQRLWADRETGLMLRAEILDADGAVLESTGFSSVEIGVRAQPESVLQPIRQSARLRVLRPVQVLTALEAEGWTLAPPPPGFRLTACVKRPASREAAADGEVQRPEGLQAVFSDGLTHVSLFVEPIAAAAPRKPLRARFGATHSLSERKGEFWLTLVGDAPLPTLQAFFDALQRRP